MRDNTTLSVDPAAEAEVVAVFFPAVVAEVEVEAEASKGVSSPNNACSTLILFSVMCNT